MKSLISVALSKTKSLSLPVLPSSSVLRGIGVIAATSATLAGCTVLDSITTLRHSGDGNILSDERIPMPQGRAKLGSTYTISGSTYTPVLDPNYHSEGMASWYGEPFHGRLTANGETFDMNQLTAAHRTMPLPSYARVTNVENGRSIIVRVNDRGPYAHNRLIDLSRETARELGMERQGVAKVRVRYLGPAETAEDTDRSKLRAALRFDRTTPEYDPRYYETRHDPFVDDVSASKKAAKAEEVPVPAVITTAKTAQDSAGDVLITADGTEELLNAEPATALVSNDEVLPAADDNAAAASAWATAAVDQQELPALEPEVAQPQVAASEPTPSSFSATPSSNFFVQAGAFSNPVNAIRMRNVLREIADVEIAQRQSQNGDVRYMVRVGPFNDRATATEIIGEMRARVSSIKPFIVAPK